MSEAFGRLLRGARQAAGKTLEDLAIYLNVSIPYISEVERGNRAPLTPLKIREASALLGVRPDALLQAAAESRGYFELVAPPNEAGKAAGAALMRGWSDFSPDDFNRISSMIEELLRKRGLSGD
jgi:transcriptional regulator with XRE-family HTH domain